MKNYGFSELKEDLEKLKAIYNEEATVTSMGKSGLGREIFLIKIGNGEKKCLVLSSIHGREQVTSLFIMKSLLELQEIKKNSSLFVVPMVNPDGVEISLGREMPEVKIEDFKPELFKNNANNINLNANFPYFFEKVPDCRQGGVSPASESETQAIINLCEKENFTSAISLHVRGNCIFWRDSGNGEVKGDFNLSESLSEKCSFELISPTEKVEDYSGGFENWFRYKFHRPALCVELVEDEAIPYSAMCESFEKAVNWEKTKNFLSTYLNFS